MFNLKFIRDHKHIFKLTGEFKSTKLNYINIVEGIIECGCGEKQIAIQFTPGDTVTEGSVLLSPYKVK